MSNKYTEFNLPVDSYAAFDASTLKSLINKRLTGNGVFTDQIMEGSNLSSIIDIIAYSYHVLIYYLNRTSNESMFSQSEIYENMNRIVKLLNYKPVGSRTSVLPFTVTATKNLSRGIYTIPRYSFIDVDGVKYSFNQDITFSKSTDLDEILETVANDALLYQGQYTSYPKQYATGEPSEIFYVTLPDSIEIDHDNIDVYVYKSKSKKYVQYTEVQSLYFSSPADQVFEKRYNENGRYEITFGNNINGVQLEENDFVQIYYLKSDGPVGKISANMLEGKPLVLYTSVEYLNIQKDIAPDDIIYLGLNDVLKLKFANSTGSTDPTTPEDVETMRKYSPEFFKTQNRLVTANDYKTFIIRRFGNVLNDVQVVSNSDYVSNYLGYLSTTLGLTRPSLESRALYNQVQYSDSTNFNNVYLFVVPKVERKTSAAMQTNFLAPSQKELIKNGLLQNKMLTTDIAFQDPVYIAVDIGASLPGETPTPSITNNTMLVVERGPAAKKNADEIKKRAAQIFINYFAHSQAKLGQEIDIASISSQLVGLDGVQRVYMTRSDAPSFKLAGVSLLMWNPVYEDKDIEVVNQNISLPVFKFPYMFDEAGFIDKIVVTQATN